MEQQNKSYNHILKATGLFGGVQVIQTFIDLARGKLIAILLGPAGMGISSLLTSSTQMISDITGFGLNFSAVRDISVAAETQNDQRISRITSVFRRWILFSGLLGAIITIILASFLSKVAFGNKEYTIAFILISCILFFNALYKGNIAILQGMRKLNDLVKASIIGSFFGLIISAPLYYFFGINGIVPAIILTALSLLIISSFYTNKIKQVPSKVSFKDTLNEGRTMIELGAIMMINVFIGTLVIFLVNAFIRYKGSVSDVGLYQAGLGISYRFIGLVFLAMASDFFPRLAAISNDNRKVNEMVNQQAEIVILLAAPLLIALIVSTPLIIKLLLSPEFFPITVFIRWVAIGMMFQVASYSVGYISFAKGDKWVFFWVEGIMGKSMKLTFNLISYYFWGLKGLGISYLVIYIAYYFLILVITNKLYSFRISTSFIRIFSILTLICGITFISTFIFDDLWVYFGGGILFILSGIYSFREIDKRTGIKTLLISKFRKIGI